jgi:hypothetical protein
LGRLAQWERLVKSGGLPRHAMRAAAKAIAVASPGAANGFAVAGSAGRREGDCHRRLYGPLRGGPSQRVGVPTGCWGVGVLASARALLCCWHDYVLRRDLVGPSKLHKGTEEKHTSLGLRRQFGPSRCHAERPLVAANLGAPTACFPCPQKKDKEAHAQAVEPHSRNYCGLTSGADR